MSALCLCNVTGRLESQIECEILKKVFLIGFTLMCFVAIAGCKTKPPKVAHPYVQEYVAGREHGNVKVQDFLDHGEEFAIGADENGKAVSKDPQKAFEALVRDYSDGINLIRDEYKLGPITPRNFYDYMTYGWQVNTGTEESKNQAAFVTQVLDIYENSYDFDK